MPDMRTYEIMMRDARRIHRRPTPPSATGEVATEMPPPNPGAKPPSAPDHGTGHSLFHATKGTTPNIAPDAPGSGGGHYDISSEPGRLPPIPENPSVQHGTPGTKPVDVSGLPKPAPGPLPLPQPGPGPGPEGGTRPGPLPLPSPDGPPDPAPGQLPPLVPEPIARLGTAGIGGSLYVLGLMAREQASRGQGSLTPFRLGNPFVP